MANVTPGYTFTSASDPITYTKLNLIAQPTITLGTNEVAYTNLPALSSNNILLGRATTGAGNYEAISLLTTGLGFYVGAGGTVTQATDKTTTVVLSKMTGKITMNAAALNAGIVVSFTLTNTLIASTDLLLIEHVSGGTPGSYTVTAGAGSGSATIYVRNNTAGNLSEAIVLRFAVLKSVDS
jgi:hypothetical protein